MFSGGTFWKGEEYMLHEEAVSHLEKRGVEDRKGEGLRGRVCFVGD